MACYLLSTLFTISLNFKNLNLFKNVQHHDKNKQQNDNLIIIPIIGIRSLRKFKQLLLNTKNEIQVIT